MCSFFLKKLEMWFRPLSYYVLKISAKLLHIYIKLSHLNMYRKLYINSTIVTTFYSYS